MNDKILKILVAEYDAAVMEHPKFAALRTHAVCLIAEELGELAQEINNDLESPPQVELRGWRERAIREAAHVAVTAIRTMEALLEGEI